MTRHRSYPLPLFFVALSILALATVACGGAQTATPTPSTTGTVRVMVTDAPPSGVTAIVVTASKIEAHRADAAEESGWDVLIQQPVTFDLVKVQGVEQFLGSQTLPPGRYTQVRFSVDKTVVTYQGTDKTADVPSDKVRVVGEFTVTQGEVTVLTLDFDADKSVVIAGADKILLKPTLKLLERKGSAAAATPTPTPTTAAQATPTPTLSPSASTTGTVQVRVTDAPPSGVTAIVITASKIEAHRADAAEESGWDVLVQQPASFDLVKVQGIEQLLGQQTLPPGRYTQVRFSVDKTVVTYQGTDKTADVPSDKIRVVGEFTVTQGEVTVLTLDFDADKSVVITGQDKVLLKPTLKLLVRKGGVPAATATPTTAAPAPTATVVASTPTPTTAAPAPTATPTTAAPVPTATVVAPTPTPTTASQARAVNISGFAFSPASVTVPVGTTVTWTNQDTTPHTVTAAGGAFNSPNLPRNQSFSFTFTAPGTYSYHCTPHPSMTGTVVVQ